MIGVTLALKCQRQGGIPTNHSRCRKTRMIDISCGVKMWADVSFVSSQFTRLSDERTDGQTFVTANVALHSMQRVKIRNNIMQNKQ